MQLTAQKAILSALTIAVVVEAGYIVRLNRAVSAGGLPWRAAVGADVSSVTAIAGPADRPAVAAVRSFPARAVPVFTDSAPSKVPVLEMLDSPEGRQRLREVLTAMKEQRRVDKFLQSSERRDLLAQRLHDRIGSALALDADDARKAQALLADLSATHRRAVNEIRSGLKSRAEAKRDLDSATTTIETNLKALLGDKGMTALRDLRKQQDLALRAESMQQAGPQK